MLGFHIVCVWNTKKKKNREINYGWWQHFFTLGFLSRRFIYQSLACFFARFHSLHFLTLPHLKIFKIFKNFSLSLHLSLFLSRSLAPLKFSSRLNRLIFKNTIWKKLLRATTIWKFSLARFVIEKKPKYPRAKLRYRGCFNSKNVFNSKRKSLSRAHTEFIREIFIVLIARPLWWPHTIWNSKRQKTNHDDKS